MPVVSMFVSQHIFCCFCRGNFEYCTRLTVKSVIHPFVLADLPSVLALKTNNLSLDWVYSCLDSGRKTGRLKKIRPLAALVLIFSLHYLHKCCVPWKPTLWQSSGSDTITTHTHMKNRRKRREKMEKEDECVSFKAGPLEAILVIFGRRAFIFFVWKLLEKMKNATILRACAVLITFETQKCRKRSPRSVEFNFFINCDRQKRFSRNERRRADLQNCASDFLIFA